MFFRLTLVKINKSYEITRVMPEDPGFSCLFGRGNGQAPDQVMLVMVLATVLLVYTAVGS